MRCVAGHRLPGYRRDKGGIDTVELIVITGLSGAGKSQAVNVMEDMGYYCIDNIPPALIARFFEVCIQTEGKVSKVAVVADARSGDFFYELVGQLDQIRSTGIDVKILFLDCAANVLVRRYKETRRRHPLLDVAQGSLEKAVQAEQLMLSPIKERANYVIDTSLLSISQLKQRIIDIFAESSSEFFQLSTLSFGFKYGVPVEADRVFDVRFLPNPFYIDELKHQTGLDQPVYDYVFERQVTRDFMNKLLDLLDFTVPLYQQEGKSQLVIGIGCTGGKHRSVAIAETICRHFGEKGYKSKVTHRDILKDR